MESFKKQYKIEWKAQKLFLLVLLWKVQKESKESPITVNETVLFTGYIFNTSVWYVQLMWKDIKEL